MFVYILCNRCMGYSVWYLFLYKKIFSCKVFFFVNWIFGENFRIWLDWDCYILVV